MTRTEHLLTIAGEECNEIAQRTSKALRFGLDQIQPGQGLTNRDRVIGEYTDLIAVLEMLGIDIVEYCPRSAIDAKKLKVERFLAFSRQCGTLTPTPHAYQRCTMEATGKCSGCRTAGLDCMYEALAICSVCGGSEGSLLPDCPGRPLSYDEDAANYQHYCAGTGPFACVKHGPAPHHICEGCHAERGTYVPLHEAPEPTANAA